MLDFERIGFYCTLVHILDGRDLLVAIGEKHVPHMKGSVHAEAKLKSHQFMLA